MCISDGIRTVPCKKIYQCRKRNSLDVFEIYIQISLQSIIWTYDSAGNDAAFAQNSSRVDNEKINSSLSKTAVAAEEWL